MSEKQVDRGLMAAAKWLVSRPNTKKIVMWTFVGAVIALLVAFVMGAFAHAAHAAAPDLSFAATTLGLEDPTLKEIANAVFWLLLGLAIIIIILEYFRAPKVRDRYTAAEYNEAIGLRRHYVQDGGSLPDGILHPEPMPVGTAVYIVGVIAVERLFALGCITLVVYAVVS